MSMVLKWSYPMDLTATVTLDIRKLRSSAANDRLAHARHQEALHLDPPGVMHLLQVDREELTQVRSDHPEVHGG